MNVITRFGAVLLIAALPVQAKANQDPTAMRHVKCWAGTLTAVNTQDKSLTGKHWQFTKTFYLGQKCAISAVDKKKASLGDLSPGEEVRIRYHDAEGVLVANRIVERALRYDGTVQTVNSKAGVLTMTEPPLYRPFRAPERFHVGSDCKVILWNGHNGRLADVQPGDRVSVVYELPNSSQVAFRIQDKSETAKGVADAIDLSARTLKAKLGSEEKQFAVGDDCKVILGRPQTGQLKDVPARSIGLPTKM